MTTEVSAPRHDTLDAALVQRLSEGLVLFLESNALPDNLFAADVFCDLSLPQWRIQTDSVDALLRVRRESHPDLGRVSHWRSDPTPDGFVFEFVERWTDASGESWLARELLRTTVADGRIAALSVYCTGDWNYARQDEHARTVSLIRP